ncbi:MAG: hypothetical protein LBT40_07255 [Deltaproteobacteria bacterium]|jgi:hypothetical protein|nr:hypothetical protein [Deltaproteobacteria bacterium]
MAGKPPRSGPCPLVPFASFEAAREELLRLLDSPPPASGRGFWTQRLLARELGVSIGSVRKIMARDGLLTGAKILRGRGEAALQRAELAARARQEADHEAIFPGGYALRSPGAPRPPPSRQGVPWPSRQRCGSPLLSAARPVAPRSRTSWQRPRRTVMCAGHGGCWPGRRAFRFPG